MAGKDLQGDPIIAYVNTPELSDIDSRRSFLYLLHVLQTVAKDQPFNVRSLSKSVPDDT